ncbi:hypothetical protein H1C71_010460 [Ictidomys tridecemlineatus]|nr:hypothetical protein H1C71_010460 [Ictidomys tridecemlineatus]
MENLLKLCLFLLCMEIATTLECRECVHYTNNICDVSVTSCTAGEGEFCMTRSVWSLPNPASVPESAESMCVKDCQPNEEVTETQKLVTNCCNDRDFCNDINEQNLTT